MKDAISAVIDKYDRQGKYLDSAAVDQLKSYFATGELRVRAASAISANAQSIIKEATARALLYSSLTRTGGNMYYARRFAACIRDMEYFLRYATFAMVAGDTSLLDEYVLGGLKETYTSLGVPIDATVKGINALREVVASVVGTEAAGESNKYFDYLAKGLQ
jgi:allophycocyanin beta subunit